MKKTLSILLFLMLLLTACGSKEIETTKTEEELREEIKAELKAELEAESNQEQSKVDNKGEELGEHEYILEGVLMSNIPPYGPGIKLSSPFKINRTYNGQTKEYTFEEVYSIGEEIYNYVDRSAFTYDEPFIVLRDDVTITVKIKFDFTDFSTFDEIIEDGYLWASDYEILELNGNSELVDKSGEPYSFDIDGLRVDITDRDSLIDFICKEYIDEDSRTILQKDLETVYADFTGDGTNDVICFVKNVTEGFYSMVFITEDNGNLEVIPFEGEEYQKNSHSSYYDGTFIHYLYEYSGYGMSGTNDDLFIYDGSKIKHTSATLRLAGSEAQRPTSKFPDGYETQWKGTVSFDNAQDDYTAFTLETVQTGSYEWEKKERYTYNKNTKLFNIETLIDTTNDNSPQNSNSSTYIDPNDIKIGQNIGGLKVSSVDYIEGNELILELNGKTQLEGIITGSFNDMYGENEFYFTPNIVFDQPVKYTFDSGWSNSIENFTGVFNADGVLNEESQSYILEGNTLEVFATVTGFYHGYRDETEGGQTVTVSNIEIQTN